METSVNERVKVLRTDKSLTQNQMAIELGISFATYRRLETEEVSGKYIKLLIETFNLNKDWLINGVGEMYIKDEFSEKKNNVSNWQEKAFEETRSQNEFLKKEIEWLRGLVNQMSGSRAQANFNNGFAGAGFHMLKIGETVRVA